ncbi:MAG: pantoate--beta-alanine ligase [Isosphaeraceae bacterium]
MTRVAPTVREVRDEVSAARAKGLVIGLVPTMGALHEGHVRLIEACRSVSGFVVVSIFVNPTQFGPREDFSRYPRTPESDLDACRRAGTDLIFAPSAEEMYPRGLSETCIVEVPRLSTVLEGASRPGHFRGVATVVTKLFGIVRPDLAFFGAKDYQQQLVIRRFVADLNLPVEVRTVDTVREADGLAMSSRNRYLDPAQRQAATVLSKALQKARAEVMAGERDANRVRQILASTVESERLASLDYAEVADAETLEPLAEIPPGRKAVGLLAVRVGTTRLIDNSILTE